MRYKMMVSDFDGTIYTDDFKISDETISAVKDYREAGGLFFIATGRLYEAIKPNAKVFDLANEIVAYQGGAIFDLSTDEIIMSNNIDMQLSADIYSYIYENFKDVTVPILFYNDRCIVTEESDHITNFCNIVGVEPIYTGVNLDKYVMDNDINPNKVLSMIETKYSDEFVSGLIEKFGEFVNINRSNTFLVEIVSKVASKGNAVAWLASKYGIKQEEIICIGDAENDISMIEYAGLGVAMGNAMKTTKDAADYICGTNNDNGVANVIRQIAMKE